MVYGRMARLWQLLYNPGCLLCGQRSHSHRELCAICMRELSWNRHCCSVCAAPLPEQSPIRRCGECLKAPPVWDDAYSPLLYAWPLNQLLQRFKFNSDLATGKLLGELLAEYLAAGCSTRPDLLLPVPLHAARLRQRGFNQARELARPVARRLRLSIAHPGVCVRIKDTAVQSKLDAAARHRNLRSAFQVNLSLAGAHLAILDDVLNTGATALATALQQAGAARVQVWCLARAVRNI